MFAGSIYQDGLIQVRRGDVGGSGPVEKVGADLDDAVSSDGEVCHAQLIARVHGCDVADTGWREQLLRLVCHVHVELGSRRLEIPEDVVAQVLVATGQMDESIAQPQQTAVSSPLAALATLQAPGVAP